MKIKLLKDHPILGAIAPADSVVNLHDGVAQDLVDRGIAEEGGEERQPRRRLATNPTLQKD